MQSQKNFRYTNAFQNIGWESDLFRGTELEEQSRLKGFSMKNPDFSVMSSDFSPHLPFKSSTQIFVQEILNLPDRVRGQNSSNDEEWINAWGEQSTQPRSIQHEAFEILASHRILDIAAAIKVDAGLLDKKPSDEIAVTPHDVLQAHAEVYGKIFKEKGVWRFSTILRSVIDNITSYLNNSDVLGDANVAGDHGYAAKLATSAVKHRTKAEGAHIVFNIEITAALLLYNVQQVCPKKIQASKLNLRLIG